jgi:hypothetical protein
MSGRSLGIASGVTDGKNATASKPLKRSKFRSKRRVFSSRRRNESPAMLLANVMMSADLALVLLINRTSAFTEANAIAQRVAAPHRMQRLAGGRTSPIAAG